MACLSPHFVPTKPHVWGFDCPKGAFPKDTEGHPAAAVFMGQHSSHSGLMDTGPSAGVSVALPGSTWLPTGSAADTSLWGGGWTPILSHPHGLSRACPLPHSPPTSNFFPSLRSHFQSRFLKFKAKSPTFFSLHFCCVTPSLRQ